MSRLSPELLRIVRLDELLQNVPDSEASPPRSPCSIAPGVATLAEVLRAWRAECAS